MSRSVPPKPLVLLERREHAFPKTGLFAETVVNLLRSSAQSHACTLSSLGIDAFSLRESSRASCSAHRLSAALSVLFAQCSPTAHRTLFEPMMFPALVMPGRRLRSVCRREGIVSPELPSTGLVAVLKRIWMSRRFASYATGMSSPPPP